MKYMQLRAFLNVADYGGFSVAAKALGLTQPALSDQVRSLEQEYDILLFDRRKKQISLTDQGSELLNIIRPMFETQALALEYLTESRAITSGTLRVIADSAFHLTDLLSRFRKKFPKVLVTLRSGNSAEVEAELAAYRADIGVLGSTIEAARFRSISLGTSPIVAFAAKGFARFNRRTHSLAELAAHPLVFREQGSKTRQKLENAAKMQNVTLRPSIIAEGREAVREIVASGGGIGFVSAAEYGQDVRLVQIQIAGPMIPMEETVVCIRNRSEVRVIRAFMGMAGD